MQLLLFPKHKEISITQYHSYCLFLECYVTSLSLDELKEWIDWISSWSLVVFYSKIKNSLCWWWQTTNTDFVQYDVWEEEALRNATSRRTDNSDRSQFLSPLRSGVYVVMRERGERERSLKNVLRTSRAGTVRTSSQFRSSLRACSSTRCGTRSYCLQGRT